MTEVEKYTSRVDQLLQLARKEALARAGFFGAVSGSLQVVRFFYPVTLDTVEIVLFQS